MLDEILRTDDEPASPSAGIEVYRSAYRNRLLEALRTSYEKTCQFVGGEAFDAAACHHIILNPPTSWTLDDYGAGFDLTLAELFAEDPEVAELAWLEWHMQQAFGSVDVVTLDAAKLASGELGIVDWDRACFTLVPSVAMRPIRTDCIALWQALADEAELPPAQKPADLGQLIVWRKDMLSHFRVADRAEGQALGAIAAGQEFGSLCASLTEQLGPDAALSQAGGWLAQWFQDGLIARVSASDQAFGP
jgi:Putative DNA-binding domain